MPCSRILLCAQPLFASRRMNLANGRHEECSFVSERDAVKTPPRMRMGDASSKGELLWPRPFSLAVSKVTLGVR